MAYKLATAFVDVVARMSSFDKGLKEVQNDLTRFLDRFRSLGGALGISLGLGAAVAAAYRFIGAATEAYDSESRLRAVIEATGKAAGFAAEDILDMSSAIMSVTTFDDDAITNAASKLLTFKKVVGDTFERALKLSADLSAVGFGSIQGAAVQLGKALEDPVRGIGALRRAGVSFTEQEKKLIKSLVESNQLLKAQTMILDAVAGQVGGVAEGMAKTPAGQWKQIQVALGNVAEELGKRILPIAVQIGHVALGMAKGFLAAYDAIAKVNSVLGGVPVKLALTVAVLSQLPPLIGAVRVAFNALNAAMIKGALLNPYTAALVVLAAVLVTLYEIGKAISKIAIVQKIWSDAIAPIKAAWLKLSTAVSKAWEQVQGKLLYAWETLKQTMSVAWQAVLRGLGPVLDLIQRFTGIAITGFETMTEMVAKFISIAIHGLAEMIADAAEWSLVIVTQWQYAQAALYAGIGFIASAALDMLIHAFTAPFQIMLQTAIQVFEAIPRLLEAALNGGIEGVAAQVQKELTTALKNAVKIATDLKISPETEWWWARLHRNLAALKKAKEDLEKNRKFPAKPDPEAEKKKKKDKKGPIELDIKSGLQGLTDAWRIVQEAMLKAEQDDPMADIAKGVGDVADLQGDLLNEFVDLNKNGIRLRDVATA